MWLKDSKNKKFVLEPRLNFCLELVNKDIDYAICDEFQFLSGTFMLSVDNLKLLRLSLVYISSCQQNI